MNYQEFKKNWFENLSEEIQSDRKSMFALDIEAELESLCKEEFLKTSGDMLKRYHTEAAQRKLISLKFEKRGKTPATADFDLPAGNDYVA